MEPFSSEQTSGKNPSSKLAMNNESLTRERTSSNDPPKPLPILKISSGIKPSQDAIKKRTEEKLINEVTEKFNLSGVSTSPIIERVDDSPQTSPTNVPSFVGSMTTSELSSD